MELTEIVGFLASLFIMFNAGFLGVLFLTTKSTNRRASLFLGLYLLAMALTICDHIISHPQIEAILGISDYMMDPFMLILPLLFFYLRTTINMRGRKWHYLLFVPGLIHCIFIPENGFAVYEYFNWIFEIALTIYGLRILKKHKKDIGNFYSDVEHKSLSWLIYLFVLNISLNALIMVSEVLEILAVEHPFIGYTLQVLVFGNWSFTVFWIGHNGFRQSVIFEERLIWNADKDEVAGAQGLEGIESDSINLSDKKPIQQQKSSEEDIHIFNEIKDEIQGRRLFADSNLTLPSLAARLSMKEKELSRLINECGSLNFYQFVNQFRVEEFKALSTSSKAKQLSILGLALEAGFSSKSTFYSVFKSQEGMTPTEYIKAIKKSD